MRLYTPGKCSTFHHLAYRFFLLSIIHYSLFTKPSRRQTNNMSIIDISDEDLDWHQRNHPEVDTLITKVTTDYAYGNENLSKRFPNLQELHITGKQQYYSLEDAIISCMNLHTLRICSVQVGVLMSCPACSCAYSLYRDNCCPHRKGDDGEEDDDEDLFDDASVCEEQCTCRYGIPLTYPPSLVSISIDDPILDISVGDDLPDMDSTTISSLFLTNAPSRVRLAVQGVDILDYFNNNEWQLSGDDDIDTIAKYGGLVDSLIRVPSPDSDDVSDWTWNLADLHPDNVADEGTYGVMGLLWGGPRLRLSLSNVDWRMLLLTSSKISNVSELELRFERPDSKTARTLRSGHDFSAWTCLTSVHLSFSSAIATASQYRALEHQVAKLATCPQLTTLRVSSVVDVDITAQKIGKLVPRLLRQRQLRFISCVSKLAKKQQLRLVMLPVELISEVSDIEETLEINWSTHNGEKPLVSFESDPKCGS
jgi:hypothetical protein